MVERQKSTDSEIEALEARADELLRRHRERYPIPEIIYHYTSFRAACSILNGLDIWFTDATCSLDRTEGLYADEVFEAVLTRDPNPTSDYFVRGMLATAGKTHCYLTCFSSSPSLADQRLNYADRGRGAVLGLVARSLAHRERDPHFFSPVEYERELQEAMVAELQYIFTPSIESAMAMHNSERLHRIVSSLGYYIVIVKALLKNPSYAHEHEYRFYNILPSDPALHNVPLKHFQRGELSVPYFSVSIADSQLPSTKYPIREVWIGPCRDFAESVAAIRADAAYRDLLFDVKSCVVKLPCDEPPA